MGEQGFVREEQEGPEVVQNITINIGVLVPLPLCVTVAAREVWKQLC